MKKTWSSEQSNWISLLPVLPVFVSPIFFVPVMPGLTGHLFLSGLPCYILGVAGLSLVM
ncbi:MAG: hypothetical protein J6T35_04925 [Bacteroidales bacterium]|nr:hypothetical protein [Bacteroidales bacterium]